MRDDPKAYYESRLAYWQSTAERLARIDQWFSRLRLGVAVAAVAAGWLAFGQHLISGWWLVGVAAPFPLLVLLHEHNARMRVWASRGLVWQQFALRRLAGQWMGRGNAGERFRRAGHVFAEDLDLFGAGSLFELLSTARTSEGEATLARWLLTPAPRAVALARQQAVAELRARPGLREDLFLLGERVRANLHPEILSKWGAAVPVRLFPGAPVVFLVLSLAALAALAGWFGGLWTLRPFLSLVLVVTGVTLWFRARVESIAQRLDTPARELAVLALLAERIEREPGESAHLTAIREKLKGASDPASVEIARLEAIATRLDESHNLFFAPLAHLLFWKLQWAMALERWRARCGPRLGAWCEAIGEYEALCSLATYAWEHPTTTFPELLESGRLWEGAAVAHPLLAEADAVPNDVTLSDSTRLLMVSGSNMSGKSTLLRSVGLNTILAWAGAPVRAARLRLAPFRLGAAIRTVDSLQEGRSRFYAEITRLRQIVDLTETPGPPVLFLLDELLSGTNSHDRAIGAAGILRSLIHRGASGLVTTHDLALTAIPSSLNGHGVNVHFEDRIDSGEIQFDYLLRPGVVQRTNALALMRSLGLDV